MKVGVVALALPLALALGACSEAPVAPDAAAPGRVLLQKNQKGTGLAVNVVPRVGLPLSLGGSVTIDQAVITNFALPEHVVGPIVGLEVTGTLTGTAVDVLGKPGLVGLDAQPFTAVLTVTSSGPGQCGLAKLDLTNLDLGALGIITVDVPATVDVKGSGAVGVLLCNLGQALAGIGSALGGNSVQGLVNAINNQIR